jgi:hypothetical protein
MRGMLIPFEGAKVFGQAVVAQTQVLDFGSPKASSRFDTMTFKTAAGHQINLLESSDGGMLNFIWHDIARGTETEDLNQWFIGDRKSIRAARKLMTDRKCEIVSADTMNAAVYSWRGTKITVFETMVMATRRGEGSDVESNVVLGLNSLYVVPESKDPVAGVEELRKLNIPGVGRRMDISLAPQEIGVIDVRQEAGHRKFIELLDSPPMVSIKNQGKS